MFKPTITTTSHNFDEGDCLYLAANSLESASRELGCQTKTLIDKRIATLFSGLNPAERQRRMSWAMICVKNMTELAESGLTTIDGVNWLARYMSAFHHYCLGAQINAAIGAFLQMEVMKGCQTLVVQDKETGIIRFIHSEEDGQYYSSVDGDAYDYRLVKMTLPDKTIQFLAYPGLCGWGSAFGINQDTGFTVLVDDLWIKDEFYSGLVWMNAVAFMALDCGSIDRFIAIMNTLKQYPGISFTGGYALQLIESGPQPEIAQVECAARHIRWLVPVDGGDRFYYAHTNFVIHPDLKKYSETSWPELGRQWHKEAAILYEEMHGKHERLNYYGHTFNWLGNDVTGSIQKGLQLLAEPEADLRRYDEDGLRCRYCCLPSTWTVAHLTGYIDYKQSNFHIGKLTPPPIPGREYSLTVKPHYPYLKRDLWLEADKALKAHEAGKVPAI